MPAIIPLIPSLLVEGEKKVKARFLTHIQDRVLRGLHENVYFRDIEIVPAVYGEQGKFITLRAKSCGRVSFAVQELNHTYIHASTHEEEQDIYDFIRARLNEHRITQPRTPKAEWLWITKETLPSYFSDKEIFIPGKPIAQFRRILMDDLFMGRRGVKACHLSDMQLKWLFERALWLMEDGPVKARERFNEMLAFSKQARKNSK